MVQKIVRQDAIWKETTLTILKSLKLDIGVRRVQKILAETLYFRLQEAEYKHYFDQPTQDKTRGTGVQTFSLEEKGV